MTLEAVNAAAPYLIAVSAVVLVLALGGAAKLRALMAGDGHFGVIEGYVGHVRNGKTMLAVQDCITEARALSTVGRCVLASNIKIMADGVEAVIVPTTDDGLDLDFLTDLALTLREQGGSLVLLIDEAGIVMPARQWASFPVGLMWLLQQSGKLRVTIRWTSQDVAFVDSQLRALTAVVHKVVATPPPTIARRLEGKRPWAMTVTTSIPAGVDKPDRMMKERRVRYRREWEAAYDTDAAVLPAGRLKGAAALTDRMNGTSGARRGDSGPPPAAGTASYRDRRAVFAGRSDGSPAA